MTIEVFIPATDKNREPVRSTLQGALAQALHEFGATNRLDISSSLRRQMAEINSARETNTAYLSTFADLIDQGWTIDLPDDFAYLTRPKKEMMSNKQQLLARRDDSLEKKGTAEFLRLCEQKTAGHRPISMLFHDGIELKKSLDQVCENKIPLNNVIKPILVPALPNERDQVTGLLLTDIWRYCRHTWSLEYKSVPGRQLPFLLRNAAHKDQPIMGIGSLASAVLQNTTRENWIGWSFDAVAYKVLSGEMEIQSVVKRLKEVIREKCDLILKNDLGVSADEIAKPDHSVIQRLIRQAAKAEADRIELLKNSDNDYRKKNDFRHMFDEDLESLSKKNPLWIKKRAEQLAKALECREFLDDLDPKLSRFELYSALFTQKDGKAITESMLSELRTHGTASNIADLSVCGAIPPYNHLLGGKLVALSAFSKELHIAYHKRYQSSVSEITSVIAGKRIFRPTNLEVITTTSMYGRSSQYNRINLQQKNYPELKQDMQWKSIGYTMGQGVFHFSDETSKLLNEYFQFQNDYRHVNNVFGEGTSPKMRNLRTSLALLGFDAEQMISHGHKREFFASAQNNSARENLFFGKKSSRTSKATMKEIGNAWMERWVQKRLKRPETLQAISEESFEKIANSLRPRSYDKQYKLI